MVARKYIFLILLIITSIIIFFIVDRLFMNKSLDNTNNSLDNTTDHPLNYSLIIPKNELPQKMLDALAGDIDTAYDLGRHYGGGLFDIVEAIYWYTITVENGSYSSQFLLATYYLGKKANDEMKTRGIFWLYMMARDDFRETMDWLKDMGYSLDTAQPPDDDNFPNDYTQLSEADIVLCKNGALQGNKKAAWLLGKYYEEIQVNRDFFKYWYRIGTQNGSRECQYILSQILLAENDELAQVRGQFWFEKYIVDS